MPEIPLYKQQTRVSAETPQGMMLDLSSESAALARTANVEIQGMENLTEGVAQAITNYETLVDEAAMADFGNEVRDFKLNLVQGGIKFRDQTQGKPYDFQADYIEPEIEKFKQRLSEKKYSKRIRAELVREAEQEFDNIRSEQAIAEIEFQTKNKITTLKNTAVNMIISGDYASGKAMLDELKFDQGIDDESYNSILNDATVAYFEKGHINTETGMLESWTNQLQVDEMEKNEIYKALPPEIQRAVLSNVFGQVEEFTKTIKADNYKFAVDRINEIAMGTGDTSIYGVFTLDDIERLNLGGDENLKKSLVTMYNRAMNMRIAKFVADEDSEMNEISLAGAFNDIGLNELQDGMNKLLKEYYMPTEGNNQYKYKNKDLQDMTKNLVNEIMDSGLPADIQYYYLDYIANSMKQGETFQAFASNDNPRSFGDDLLNAITLGKGGFSNRNNRYRRDTQWLWQLTWSTYDNASNNMPIDKFSSSMLNVPTAVSSKLKNDREYNEDTLQGLLNKEKITIEDFMNNSESYIKNNATFKNVNISNRLIFDKNGNLFKSKHNLMVMNKYLDNTFSDYWNYTGDYIMKESLGVRSASRYIKTPTTYEDKAFNSLDELLKAGEFIIDEY
tara:strand:- start:9685 stop:11538 length:1854 start_codon:yes stop_codon:yes gene_type:complete